MPHGDADLGELIPRSVFYAQGRFGRLFPTLPPFAADTKLIRDALAELGVAGGPMDPGDDLSDPITLIRHCCIEPEGGTETQQSGGSSSLGGRQKASNRVSVPPIGPFGCPSGASWTGRSLNATVPFEVGLPGRDKAGHAVGRAQRDVVGVPGLAGWRRELEIPHEHREGDHRLEHRSAAPCTHAAHRRMGTTHSGAEPSRALG